MSQRNYLFAVSQDDVALTRLIATSAAATGFMKGAPGGALPGWHQLGQDNRGFLETLYSTLEASYPAGGQPFYAVRLWTNLIWQPAYLAVIAVHLHGALPDLSHIAQNRSGIYVDGFRLQPGPQTSGDVETLIGLAGAQLRGFADAVFDEINAVKRLKRVPALRLLAERMLSLMVRLRHFRPDVDLEAQLRFCALWLGAMGLEGQGALEVIDLGNGAQGAIVGRKGCCLDYLAMPDTYCASCPKQDKAVRVARQRDNLVAEMRA